MKRLLITTLTALFAVINLCSQTFSAPVVASPITTNFGSAGMFPSHLVVNGNPAVAYYDSRHENLVYRRALNAQGTVWDEPVIISGYRDQGRYCSMQIIDGFPAVAYLDYTYRILKYVRALDVDGSLWGEPVIADATPGESIGWFASLCEVNGAPAIAYYENNFGNLKYIRATDNTGINWGNPQTLVSTDYPGINAKMIMVNGHPAIVHHSDFSGTINYLRSIDSSGSNWGPEVTISSTGDNGYELGFCIVNGNPAVSYYDMANTSLKYVRANNADGSSWSPAITIDNNGSVGRYTSMTIAGGYPVVAYQSANDSTFLFVRAADSSGTTWNSPISVGVPGTSNSEYSIAIIDNQPAVAFFLYQLNRSYLGYIRATDSIGSNWGTALSFSGSDGNGFALSATLVQGRPAIVSKSAISYWTVYNRASDVSGTQWDSVVYLDSVTGVTAGNHSMNIINGAPAVAYYSSLGNDLKFIRALDSFGNTWSTPRKVDSTNMVGRYCQLLNVMNKPEICYYDNTDSRIKFIMAQDSFGMSWNSPSYPTGQLTDGIRFNVCKVAESAGIVFTNSAYTELYYTYALDSLFTNWSTPVLIANNVLIGSRPSMTTVDGKPAISYGDNTTNSLYYCIATDSLGSSWNAPILVEQTFLNGEFSDLEIVSGRPVISFAGENHEQVFVQSNDHEGQSWGTPIFLDSTDNLSIGSSTSIINMNGVAGVAYYNQIEKYAYFTSACITPLEPQVAPTLNVCDGDTAILSASGYGTLSWYDAPTGGNYLGSGNTFNAGALSDTTTFYVQDSTCAAGARAAITVNVIPLPVINLLGGTTMCNGWTIALNVIGTGYSWLWSTGSTSSNALFTPPVTTNYTVQATDINGCTSILPFTITVIQPVTFNQTVTICENETFAVATSVYHTTGVYVDSTETPFGCDSIIITDLFVQPLIDTTVTYSSGMLTSSEINAQYQWFDCTTFQNVNGATSQTFIPTQNGTYAAAIIAGPCSDTSECYTVTDVGFYDITSAAWNFVAAPNPSSGQITITTFGVQDEYVIEIVNTLGQVIAAITSNDSTEHTLQIETPGVFLVKVRVNGSVKAQRIVVQ